MYGRALTPLPIIDTTPSINYNDTELILTLFIPVVLYA